MAGLTVPGNDVDLPGLEVEVVLLLPVAVAAVLLVVHHHHAVLVLLALALGELSPVPLQELRDEGGGHGLGADVGRRRHAELAEDAVADLGAGEALQQLAVGRARRASDSQRQNRDCLSYVTMGKMALNEYPYQHYTTAAFAEG